MKKLFSFLLFGAMVVVSVTSCNQNEPDDQGSSVNNSSTVQSGPKDTVNLGLPSGILWATCNVGATSPEDYGAYFAWGETKPKDNYSWINEGEYTWGIGYFNWDEKSNFGMTKYNANDGKIILDAEDDAAHVHWGLGWRMPRKAEIDELRRICKWTWTVLDGVNGYEVKDTISGNSIFLPASGVRIGSELEDKGLHVIYWSSSLHKDAPSRAFCLYRSTDNYDWSSSYRYRGRSIRPIYIEHTLKLEVDTTHGNVIGEGISVTGDTLIITDEGIYPFGQSFTITATPKDTSYLFDAWSDGIIENPRTIRLESDSTISAKFKAKEAHE